VELKREARSTLATAPRIDLARILLKNFVDERPKFRGTRSFDPFGRPPPVPLPPFAGLKSRHGLKLFFSSRRGVSQALPGPLEAFNHPTDPNVLLARVFQLLLGLPFA
jgi:hypothetical protein